MIFLTVLKKKGHYQIDLSFLLLKRLIFLGK